MGLDREQLVEWVRQQTAAGRDPQRASRRPTADLDNRSRAARRAAHAELFEAAELGSYERAASLLVEDDVDPNATDANGLTALSYAALGNVKDEQVLRVAMQVLVAAGADVNKADNDGGVPSLLMAAATPGNLAAVQWLLQEANADSRRTSKNGRTARDWARAFGQAEAAEFLERWEQEHPSQQWLDERLREASMGGDAQGVARLLAQGADPNGYGPQGHTPVWYAAQRNDTNAMEMLLRAKAGLEHSDSSGRTPLMVAAELGRTSAVQWLLMHEVDWHQIDVNGACAKRPSSLYPDSYPGFPLRNDMVCQDRLGDKHKEN
jgi:ankyrin repeat protein